MTKNEEPVNAYVTVEAAFVFPFVICTIMAVILFSFYMFGNVSAMCDADKLLLEEERVYRDTGRIDNLTLYRDARETLKGYPFSSCIVSRCYSDYGDTVIEYKLGVDTPGNIISEELLNLMSGKAKIRQAKADNRIDRARYIAVGKSIYTRVKGYAKGWGNGHGD